MAYLVSIFFNLTLVGCFLTLMPRPLLASEPSFETIFQEYDRALGDGDLDSFIAKRLGKSVDSKKRAELVQQILTKHPVGLPRILSSISQNPDFEPFREDFKAIGLSELNTSTDFSESAKALIQLKTDPKVLYEIGAAVARKEKDMIDPRTTRTLLTLAEQSFGIQNIPQSDFELFLKQSPHLKQVQEEFIRRAPESSSALLSNLFKVKGAFQESYFSDDSVYRSADSFSETGATTLMELVKEGKFKLNAERANFIEQLIKDPSLSPKAKASAFELLRSYSPERSVQVWNALLDSSDPLNHLMASQLLRGDLKNPEREQRLVHKLNQDLNSQMDLSVISLLARNPFSEQLGGKNRVFDTAQMRRLLDHPDEKVAELAIRLIKENPIRQQLIPDLLKAHLFGEIKTDKKGTINTIGFNENLSEKLLDLLKDHPEELAFQKGILIRAMEDPNNSFDRKKFIFGLLEKAGSSSLALPSLLKELSQATEEKVDWLVNKTSALLKDNPLAYRQTEPLLEAALKKQSDPRTQIPIAQLMSKMGSRPALEFLLKTLHTSQDVNDPEKDRWLYLFSAKAIGEALETFPQLLNDSLRDGLKKLLSKKGPQWTAAQNDLRKYLPAKLKTEIEGDISKGKIDPSNTDPCRVICRISDTLAKDFLNGTDLPTDNFLESAQAKGAFNLAVKSLVGEFLLKANQSGCSSSGIDIAAKKLLEDSVKFSKEEGSKRKGSVDQIQASLEMLDQNDPAIKRAIEFAKQGSEGVPGNSSSIYLMLHAHRLAGILKDSEAQKSLEKQMALVAKSKSILPKGEEGSLLTTYAFAAMGASMPTDSSLQKTVSSALIEMRQQVKDKNGTGFPYNFEKERPLQGERGSAARSVVAQLAIYKGDSKENQLSNADELMASIETYNRHFKDVFSGIGLQRTHDRYDSDQLAPYYGPSTIPYVFDALSALEKEKGLNTEQRSRLNILRSDLTHKVLEMFNPNGLFQQQHPDLYSGAHYYDNALVGLALQNACQSSKTAASSIGETESRTGKDNPSIRTH